MAGALPTSAVRILTDSNFDSETGSGLVLVDFWAPRCPPCRRLGPLLDRIAAAMTGKAAIAKCDVDEWPALAARYGVRGIPALVFLREGREVARLNGFQDEPVLLARLSTLLQA